MDKKELKQPDEFVTWGGRAARFAAENAAIVVGGALLGVVLVAAFFGWLQRRDAREIEAAGVLYAAEKLIEMPENEMFRGMKLPGITEPNPEDMKAAITKLDEVLAQYPSTKAALRARAKQGDLHMELEQWDEAIAAYEKAIGGTAVERYYALNGAAHARERKADHDGAATTYRRIVDDPGAFGRDLATLDLARALEKAGKKDAAIQVLSQFATDFPESPLKPDADRRLGALGGAPVAQANMTLGTGGT